MRLGDFLTAERCVVPLPGGTVADAARALFNCLVASGAVVVPERLRERVEEVRPEDLVVLADRAFLLHYRTDAVTELGVAIGAARSDVRRHAGDGESRARVVIMIVGPPRAAARHLQLLRGFTRLLARDSCLSDILAQDTPQRLAGLAVFAEYELPEQLTVRDVMTELPRTAHPDLPLRQAAQQMIETGLGALPVVDEDGRLLGILSERELVRHLLNTHVLSDPRHLVQPSQGRKTVRDVMTRQVMCVAPEQPIAEVAALMSNKDVDRVPVVREGRLVGYLTRGDIVRKLIGS